MTVDPRVKAETEGPIEQAKIRILRGEDWQIVLAEACAECFLRGHEARSVRWDEEPTPVRNVFEHGPRKG